MTPEQEKEHNAYIMDLMWLFWSNGYATDKQVEEAQEELNRHLGDTRRAYATWCELVPPRVRAHVEQDVENYLQDQKRLKRKIGAILGGILFIVLPAILILTGVGVWYLLDAYVL